MKICLHDIKPLVVASAMSNAKCRRSTRDLPLLHLHYGIARHSPIPRPRDFEAIPDLGGTKVSITPQNKVKVSIAPL